MKLGLVNDAPKISIYTRKQRVEPINHSEAPLRPQSNRMAEIYCSTEKSVATTRLPTEEP